MAGNLDAMYAAKLVKLEEQKALSDQMNEMLKSHLNPGSKLATKNLRAAIAVSKKPGNFEYYQPSPDVVNIESNKSLNGLAKRIAGVHKELDAMNEEIYAAEAAKKAASNKMNTQEDTQMGLNGWFETFGRPAPGQDSLLSSFTPASKIYGGNSSLRRRRSNGASMSCRVIPKARAAFIRRGSCSSACG